MLPLAAISAIAIAAFPIVLLMVAWTIVTVARLVFPERALPFDAAVRREAMRRRGRSVPVRLVDIMDDQRALATPPAMPRRAPVPEDEASAPDPLTDDLWLRRN